MGTCQIRDDLVPNLQHTKLCWPKNPCVCLIFPHRGPIQVFTNTCPIFFFPLQCIASSLWCICVMALCNISLGHLFCLFTGTAPVSLENILPLCSRWLIPALLTTKAQDFITHTGQGRYLCFSLCSLPLKQGRLGLLARQSIEPLRGAMEPPTFKFSPSFYLGFLISSSGD